MQEKRRDNKGRVLRTCERQRSDGRYEFRYMDNDGTKRSVYSWKLVATDKTPQGKKCKKALRDIERDINKRIEEGLNISSISSTFDDIFKKYIDTKVTIRDTTLGNYLRLYSKHLKEPFGNKPIVNFKYSDIKKFYISLLTDKGLGIGTVGVINSIVHFTFDLAVRDGIIPRNPSDRVMTELKRTNQWTAKKRNALSIEQQSKLMQFCSSDPSSIKWVPMIIVFLGTGCREGELSALQWDDVDFESNEIHIRHSLSHKAVPGLPHEYHIVTPKTFCGNRMIPMLPQVREALLAQKENQKAIKTIQSLDGYNNFVFTSKSGRPHSGVCIDRAIYRIIDRYNKHETSVANEEKRDPELLPKISAHILRHTFCTRLCEQERNIKIVQEIMGHASISTTMDIYNEATSIEKKKSFSKIDLNLTI